MDRTDFESAERYELRTRAGGTIPIALDARHLELPEHEWQLALGPDAIVQASADDEAPASSAVISF